MNILVLIVVILFAVFISLFSTQNTASVEVMLFNFPLIVPLYLVVFGSIIVGLAMSWLINLTESISTTLTLIGKDSALKKSKQTADELLVQINDLKLENARLKGEVNAKETNETPKETPKNVTY